jgi:hypothetical protein
MISKLSKIQTFVFLISLLGSQLGWRGASNASAMAASPFESQSTAASVRQGFTGTWYTNVAVLSLQQNGSKATGSIKGYGGNWNELVSGDVNSRVLNFGNTPFFGNLAIELSADGNSFKSTDPGISFCGVRSGPLPIGCGFSGKWYLKADIFSKGSYAILTQSGPNVTGKVYPGPISIGAPVSGEVQWAKGWWLNGKGTGQLTNFTLRMTTDEKAFQVDLGEPSAEWCGLRKGESQAWVFYFWCQP